MFFRANELSQGTLLIREIINKMNGQINVDSTYGEVTTFELILQNNIA